MRSKKNFSFKLVLASGSPRRAELLKQLGLDFSILLPEIDETPLPGEGPRQLVRRLSREKAQSLEQRARKEYSHPIVLISADTIVVAPNGKTILGKPTSEQHARTMLKMLSGKTHTVFTGYTIQILQDRDQAKRLTRVIQSKVKILKLPSELIESYLKTGEPFDKAGSYGAQGIGASLIEKIHGSFTNVVGLPVSHLSVDLEEMTGMKRLQWKMR
ncbi:septum formation protein Maf [bacterium]|nr:septum formation protein Maf [bacterium]